MADSMCGPSNALQNFQKHSTVDRTLQQDRLISKQTPSQGFRSSPGPNAQHLDPEFEAFQAGNLPLDHGFQNQGLAFSHAPPNLHQPGPANWATDFQRMNISSPQPNFQEQPFHAPAQQRLDTGEWHQDFAKQQQSQMAGPSVAQSNQMGTGYGFSPMNGQMGMGFSPQFAGAGFAGPQAENSMAQQQQPQTSEQFDEEAFARAFDEAAKSEMDTRQESSSSQQQGVELGQDILLDASAERLMSDDPSSRLEEQERIGADQIHDPNQQENQHEQDDPDALARTAARLLDSVRHDQSDKFQKSQFLELMRQFRDREAVVDGDKIVGTDGRGMDTAMSGQEQGQGRGGEGEMMKTSLSDVCVVLQKISILSHTLKRLALDRDRPFVRTSSNVRYLLQTLLQLDRVFQNADGMLSQEVIEKSRLRRTLSALVESPSLNGLPSVRILAIYALSIISNLTSHIAGVGLSFSTTGEELRGIAAANREITSLPEITQQGPISNGRGQWESEFSTLQREGNGVEIGRESGRWESEFSSPEQEFLKSSLSKTLKPRESLLGGVLGYTFTPTPNPYGDTAVSKVHEQRASDILGPAFTAVKAVCEQRGFWCHELPTSRFWELVRTYETFGSKSDNFTTVVQLVERELEGRLTEYVRGPYEGREVEVLDREQMGRVEELQGRLRYMVMMRERNRLAGEEVMPEV